MMVSWSIIIGKHRWDLCGFEYLIRRSPALMGGVVHNFGGFIATRFLLGLAEG